ncbi:MAG TPA: hypothetical protein VK425_12230, partial [Acidimicrobiales bacterium]|nr:hypothetical protein [Acidimicrobiales bacterium]
MRHLLFPSATHVATGAVPWRWLKTASAIVVAAALGGSLSSCSTAPAAATVNGAAISEQQLADQLQTLSSDPGYVQAQDANFLGADEEQYEATGQQQELFTVAPPAGAGTGAGVYGSVWTDVVLSNMIAELALQQYLARLGKVPTPSEVDAAWASEDATNPSEWQGLSASGRAGAARYDAERYLIEGAPALGPAQSFYKAHVSYFWSQVCLAAVDVPVESSGLAAANRQAQEVAEELSGHTVPGAEPVLGPSLYCDTPEQFIEQPAGFQDKVGALAPGHAVVLPAGYGYQVVEVRSRATVPFDSQVAAIIQLVTDNGGALTLGVADQKLSAVLKKADVQVNPLYGTWSTAIQAPCPPAVESAVG